MFEIPMLCHPPARLTGFIEGLEIDVQVTSVRVVDFEIPENDSLAIRPAFRFGTVDDLFIATDYASYHLDDNNVLHITNVDTSLSLTAGGIDGC